ncbi:hypothetical protein GCM10027599_27530 [Yimella radicis]
MGLRVLEEAITGTTQLESLAQTVQAVAMARYAAIDEELVDSDTGVTAKVAHALGHQASFADTELAAACQMAPRTASSKMSNSIDACTKTPGLLAAAVEESLPFWKVSLVASELVNASPETSHRGLGSTLRHRRDGRTVRRRSRRPDRPHLRRRRPVG